MTYIEEGNKIATNLMLAAAKAFAVPSSVRIIKGRLCYREESNDYAAFLQLSAINAFGSRSFGKFMIYLSKDGVVVADVETYVGEKLALILTTPRLSPDFDVKVVNKKLQSRYKKDP